MRHGAFLDAVAQLEWAPPSKESLLALAQRSAADAWLDVREDPGAMLLVLQAHHDQLFSPDQLRLPDLLDSSRVLALAAERLDAFDENQLSDWTQPPHSQVRALCLSYANEAELVARRSGAVDPNHAWTMGLLAPLGWLAALSVHPEGVTQCLDDADFAREPLRVQRRHWGADAAELARRLARRWRWPTWLAANCAQLGLPIQLAEHFGVERPTFLVTQLAVALIQQRAPALGLTVGATASELLRELQLPVAWRATDHSFGATPQSDTRSEPAQIHLRDYLSVVARHRSDREQDGRRAMERELEALHSALHEQCRSARAKLHDQKLAALAEMAAGAGHEINNPLAVISGQAQCLIAKCTDDRARRSLQTIIGQTRRIHRILRDLMQFARPPAPQKEKLDLLRLVDEVAHGLQDQARNHHVTLQARADAEAGRASTPIFVNADPKQLRTACTCLLINAIQAAGHDGWCRVAVCRSVPGHVDVLVENSGASLDLNEREHLFDPFYSGRQAGRGLGLGLPTAWSLTRQQGGDVFLASQIGESTCFVLRLPVPVSENDAKLKLAS